MHQNPCFSALLEIHEAREQISEIVHAEADARRAELGVDWRLSRCAAWHPCELRREVKACQFSGLPMRVRADNAALTVFSTAEVEVALRYWEATEHLRLNEPFSFEGSISVARNLLAKATLIIQSDSIGHCLLWAATAGRAACRELTGHEPADGLRFAMRCLHHGVDEAIDAEIHELIGGRR